MEEEEDAVLSIMVGSVVAAQSVTAASTKCVDVVDVDGTDDRKELGITKADTVAVQLTSQTPSGSASRCVGTIVVLYLVG